MTIEELYAHLCDQGYGALLRRYANGISLLDFYIQRDGEVVRVCEKERGHIIHSYLETIDEAAACDDYLARVSAQYQYLTGSADANVIVQMHSRLEAAGISVRQSELPEYLGLTDSRYRLSVPGADLKRARELLNL
jgi:hypothetical protein